MEEYKCSLLNALQGQEVIDRYRLIFEPIFKTLLEPVSNKLSQTIRSLCQTVDKLKTEAREKDEKIHKLEQDVASLKVAVDNHEQHGRRDSVRMFGISEETLAPLTIRLCALQWLYTAGSSPDHWWDLVSHKVGQSRQSSDPLPWASGLSVAIQCASNLDPIVHWNATGERIAGSQCVSSVPPAVFQWLSNGPPVCSNYAN